MNPQLLQMAAFIDRSLVNGPGTRAVIWLQGCTRRPPCAGCYNPSMQDPNRPAEQLAPQAMARKILELRELAGVTLTGGEPFLQSAALARLVAPLRAEGLTVVTFTGHTLEELQADPDPGHTELLSNTDLLVDGPYIEALGCRLPLRGSTNQRLHYLSGRIRPSDVEGLPAAEAELYIDSRGDAVLCGFPDLQLLELLQTNSRSTTKEAQ